MHNPLTSIYEAGTTPTSPEPQDPRHDRDAGRPEPDPTPRQEAEDHILTYQGFASPTPFLLEPPNAYLNRVSTAARTLLHIPADSPHPDAATRAVYSPALSIPFLLPEQGDRMNPASQRYPLLHLPDGRPYDDPELPVDAYALAVVIAYEMDDINFMGEPGDGDLTTWDNIPRYAVPDKYWTRALELAQEVYQPLRDLNLARLLAAARRDPGQRPALLMLRDAWGIRQTPDELAKAGEHARPLIEERWRELCGQAPADLPGIDPAAGADGGR